MWYLDNGCSRHMTGDKRKIKNLKIKDQGFVTYGDNNKGKIIGIGDVGGGDTLEIKDVLLVEGLKHNLLSISQLCDKGLKVIFESDYCTIHQKNSKEIALKVMRHNNIYLIDLDYASSSNITCLVTKEENPWLWHKRAAHIHMKQLNKSISIDLVIGLPKIKFEKDKICAACQKGKQVRSSFHSKNILSTSKPLELLHMDLFGPSRIKSYGGNYYALVIVDDYSRFTWTFFLTLKSEAFKAFKKFAKLVQNEKDLKIKTIRSDHGREFQNESFENFCDENGILHNFSAPRTPQQNGVVERKNRSLEELARTMLNKHNVPKYFWVDAVSTACYVLNRMLIRPILKITPYELFKGRKPNVAHLKIFGCTCFVLNNGKENLGKFDSKADEAIFLGYSLTSKAYRVFNRRTLNVEESMHVVFDEVVYLEENPLESNKHTIGDEEYIQEALDEMYLNENPPPQSEDHEKC